MRKSRTKYQIQKYSYEIRWKTLSKTIISSNDNGAETKELDCTAVILEILLLEVYWKMFWG